MAKAINAGVWRFDKRFDIKYVKKYVFLFHFSLNDGKKNGLTTTLRRRLGHETYRTNRSDLP